MRAPILREQSNKDRQRIRMGLAPGWARTTRECLNRFVACRRSPIICANKGQAGSIELEHGILSSPSTANVRFRR
jgi:hypothetical protein